jgi:hypothetical protein
MEKSEPVNPDRRVNLLVKILLYPQVTAFKIVKTLPTLSNYRNNYHSSGFSFSIIIFTEVVILYFLSSHIGFDEAKVFLIIMCAFHGLLELIFNKTIYVMAFDYYSYYNKTLLYIFLIFLAMGFVGFCIMFNNQIGHVV